MRIVGLQLELVHKAVGGLQESFNTHLEQMLSVCGESFYLLGVPVAPPDVVFQPVRSLVRLLANRALRPATNISMKNLILMSFSV